MGFYNFVQEAPVFVLGGGGDPLLVGSSCWFNREDQSGVSSDHILRGMVHTHKTWTRITHIDLLRYFVLASAKVPIGSKVNQNESNATKTR